MIDIKKVIREHGFTLDSVAKEIGVSKSTMTQYVSGNPTLSSLQAIAKVVGIPVSELLRETDANSSPTLVCPKCGEVLHLKVETE